MRRLVAPLLLSLVSLARADEAPRLDYGPAREVGHFEDEALDESSGLACGADPGVLWSHNDSGGGTRLFACDRAGRSRGRVVLDGASNIDWEDVVAFTLRGERWLAVADMGDNGRVRPELTLYFLREPPLPAEPGVETHAKVERTLRFRYPDGSHDCEGLGVDVAEGKLLLVTKDRGDGTLVFTLPLEPEGEGVLVAEPVGQLPLPMVTALDLAPDGRLAAVLTYRDLWLYPRAEGESWAEAFARPGHKVELPKLKQAEAVCFAPDGRTLLLSSEGVGAPLLELTPRQAEAGSPAPTPTRKYY